MTDLVSYLSHNTAIVLSCAIILGCTLFFIRKLIILLAAPTFAGIYYLEGLFPNFKFTIPKKGIKKFLMEICGMICTAFSLDIIISLVRESLKNTLPEEAATLVMQNIPTTNSVMICISFSIMIWISYTTKPEDKDDEWFDKIMTLKIKGKI
jgi:hypothetical protein